MVLRPDSTMPIARLCATRLRAEQLPLRLSYNQTVYSQNRTLTGRSDEVKQAGVELIGAAGLRADLEMTSLSRTGAASLPSAEFPYRDRPYWNIQRLD